MEPKIFKILYFERDVEFIIQGNGTENEVFDTISMIDSMNSFVNLSLNQVFVTKISSKYFQYNISIIVELKHKDLTINMLESKNFKFLNDIPKKSDSNPSFTHTQERFKEVKYTEQYHLANASQYTKNLFLLLKNKVLDNFVDVFITPQKVSIAFSNENNKFMYCKLRKDEIVLYFNAKKGTLNDPHNMTRDVSTVGHHGSGDYELKIYEKESIDYVMYLFKQVYSNKSR